MLLFCLLAPLLDVCSKLAAQAGIPVGQITLARFAVQGAMMLPVVLMLGLGLRLDLRSLGFVFLRAAFLVISTFSFIAGIAVMPLADALAIAFVEPFILLILGYFLFGDHIGPRRILACVLGFGGAILVIQPSIQAFGLTALWPLGTAVSFAFYMLVTRAMSGWMNPVVMQYHTSWAGLVILAPILIAYADGPVAQLMWVNPNALEWLWLVGVGFWACLAHMCMTFALKFAPASTLAPLHYLEIALAVLLGYLVFADLPNLMTFLGIGIIIGSGLFMIWHERSIARG